MRTYTWSKSVRSKDAPLELPNKLCHRNGQVPSPLTQDSLPPPKHDTPGNWDSPVRFSAAGCVTCSSVHHPNKYTSVRLATPARTQATIRAGGGWLAVAVAGGGSGGWWRRRLAGGGGWLGRAVAAAVAAAGWRRRRR